MSAAAIPNFDDFIKAPAAAPAAVPAIPHFDDFVKAAPDAAPPQAGFWSSLGTQIANLNPIPAVTAWLNQGEENAKGAGALQALDQIHADAAKDPANKGIPVNRWKTREPTAAEKAAIEAGMSAHLLSSSEGAGMTAPAMTAAGQAKEGDLPGAAGTILGGYVAPAVAGAAITAAPRVVRAGIKLVDQPGTKAMLSAGTQAVAGIPMTIHGIQTGNLETAGMGAGLAARAGQNLLKGLKQRAAAAEEARAAAAAAAPPPPPPAGSLTIQPQALGRVATVAPITAASYAPPVTSTNLLPTPPPAEVAAPPPAAAAAPSVDLLNQTARNMGARSFDTLKPEVQDAIRGAVAKYNDRLTAGADTLVRPAAPVPEAPAVTTIPPAKPEVPAQVFENAARTAKAEPLAQLLHEHGISSADAARMNDEQWGQLAKAAKVNAPSKLSQAEALFQLKKLELTAKPSPALAEALKKPGALEAARALAESQIP